MKKSEGIEEKEKGQDSLDDQKRQGLVEQFESFEDIEEIVTASPKGTIICCNQG